MTGRYYFIVPRYPARNETWERPWQTTAIERGYQEQWKGCWTRFHAICRSLHKDGLDYEVHIHLNAEVPHVLITATGKAKPQHQSKPRAFSLPAHLTRARCHLEAAEVQQFLDSGKVTRQSPRGRQRLDWRRTQELQEMAREYVEAELEYWRELELLSGQREHFKPGLADEAVFADDGVAA